MDDTAWANADFIPGGPEYPARWAADAGRFRDAIGARGRLGRAYGDSDRQVLDLFLPESRARGLVVFVHGGFWRAFDRSSWSHFAAGPVAAGWAVAVPSYTLAPAARISEIAREIVAAVDMAAGEITGPIRLIGHSAGGQLVARVAAGQGMLPDAVAGRIDRVVPVSPVADLRAMLGLAMNDVLRIDATEAEAESPVLLPPPVGARVTVWVGAEERPAFLAQATELSEAWGSELRVAAGRHHFDVLDDLTDAEAPLTRALLG